MFRTTVLRALIVGLAATTCPTNLATAEEQNTPPCESEVRLDRVADAWTVCTREAKNLHIVSTLSTEEWSISDQRWIATPMVIKARSWYETPSGGRLRIDFLPRVVRWRNGVRPYTEFWESVIWDGGKYRRIDLSRHGRSGDERTERPRHLDDSHAWWTGVALLPGGPAPFPLVWIARSREARQEFGLEVKTEWLTREGKPLLRLIQDSRVRGKHTREEMVLDPGKQYGICSYSRVARRPWAVPPERTLRLEVKEWKQLGPDVWFPIEWVEEKSEGSRRTYRAETVEFFDHRSMDYSRVPVLKSVKD